MKRVQNINAAWVVKHKPTSLKDVVGNQQTIQKIIKWVESWKEKIPKKRAAFLYGSPGVGKTVTVEALANDFNLELVEKNASDYRTKKAVEHFAGLASQYASLFGGRRIVLFDELDGLTGSADRGGVRAITEIVKTTSCPVVLIANNAYDPRFSTLRRYCLLLEFKKPRTSQVLKHLKQVCLNESIQAEENALKFIAQRSGGDVRSAVNDLQALAQSKKRLAYDDVSWLGYRDRQEKIFTVLKMIIHGKTCASAKQAVNMADVDIDMLFEWIYENVPSHLTHPQDLAKAMDALSMSDVYRGRILNTQNWGLLRYVIDYMTAGVAMAREKTESHGWIPFNFPKRIKMLSRWKAERAMKKGISQKIKRKCHISTVRASKEILPYLAIIFKNNTEMAAGITKWLDLKPEMIKYLTGTEKKAEAINKLLT
ncbi:MAG: replication factor C large subunit [Candidatus Bathyarchaeota archaeon]|jgi:replication factor C large subunit